MAIALITPPLVEPITLSEARLQCRSETADDAYMALCIAGARALCEGKIKQRLIHCTLEQTKDRFGAFDDAGEVVGAEMSIEARPASSIVSVKYIDPAGDEQTMPSDQYVLDNRSDQPWILPAIGIAWPDTELSVNAVRIRFIAGFGPDAASVPADIRSWLLLTVGFLFANRESIDVTGKAKELPSRFVDSLLDPWRTHGF